MDAVALKMLSIVDSAGGRIEYRTMLSQMDAIERQHIPSALKHLKARGLAMAQNRRDSTGQLVFEVFRLNQGAP
jgi:hypothetical protein